MRRPDFEGAREYALQRLESELPGEVHYHSIFHTRDEVAPAAEEIARLVGVAEEDLLLLRTAAYFHDLGYVEQDAENESIAARIAYEVLPGFGYSPEQVQVVVGLIMATRLPQAPQSLLEKIIDDADLYILGREDFLDRSRDLKAELAALGEPITDEEWYQSQLNFLLAHDYHTEAARKLLEGGKRKNIAALTDLLSSSSRQDGNQEVN